MCGAEDAFKRSFTAAPTASPRFPVQVRPSAIGACSAPSACEVCDASKSTSEWTLKAGYYLEDGGSCAPWRWPSCEFPDVGFMVVDGGEGISATQKVAGMGSYAYTAGYAGGTTLLKSSASELVRADAPCAPLCHLVPPVPPVAHCCSDRSLMFMLMCV